MEPDWTRKPLKEMTPDQWEQLCDGCARCCVLKEQDDDTLEVLYSDIACRFLDLDTCRCTCYATRDKDVPECTTLSPDKPEDIAWLPSTCAYRLLQEGKRLPQWHPLVTGNPNSTRDAGMSVRNRVIPEPGKNERK